MSSTPKILIVDDEPLMCDSLMELLTFQGYEALAANSGQGAKEILSKHEFELALLDMNLPDTNGHQLMDHIYSLNPKTLVIIITGHASMDSAIGAPAHRYPVGVGVHSMTTEAVAWRFSGRR